jgi:hypothetical protein
MTTSAAWTLGQDNKIQIESGGTLTATFLITNGTFQVDNGATYVHNAAGSPPNGNASDFPGTNWTLGPTSTVEFQRWANGGTSPVALRSGISWGNVVINVGTLGGSWNQGGRFTNINGNLTIKATGTKEFCMSSIDRYTATLGGDLIIEGGIFSVASGNLSTDGTTINLRGNLNQSGGTFTMYGNSGASADFIFDSGGGPASVTYSKGTGTFTPGSKLSFIVPAGKTLTLNDDLATATDARRTMTVNGTLNCGSKSVIGSAGFVLGAGATLGIGSTAGITSTAGQGNIQVTGTRAYTTGANYVYNGTDAQVTGDQLPSKAGAIASLTINNGYGVSLSGNVSIAGGGTLTVNSGAGLDLNSHTVTVAAAPVLDGALTMEVNKTGPNTFTGSKLTQTAGTLTYGGALIVNSVGAALTGGEVFDLFDAPAFNASSSFNLLTLPSLLGSGPNWYTGNLTVDGTIIVNRAPQAQDISMGAQSGVKQTLQIIGSPKYAPTDLDGNALSLSAVNCTSGHGATVNINGNSVEYTAPSTYTGPDSFTYTVSDGWGGTAVASVALTVSAVLNQQTAAISFKGGSVSVVFWGVPGDQYVIQRSTDLSDWADVGTATANDLSTQPYGQINFTDSAPPQGGSGYYRLKP